MSSKPLYEKDATIDAVRTALKGLRQQQPADKPRVSRTEILNAVAVEIRALRDAHYSCEQIARALAPVFDVPVKLVQQLAAKAPAPEPQPALAAKRSRTRNAATSGREPGLHPGTAPDPDTAAEPIA